MSQYLSKTVRCWRNVPSNQVLFSFLRLHWYYIQSLFESSKPLSSDKGIVITGTLNITYRAGNSAFLPLPFGKYINIYIHGYWISNILRMDVSENRGTSKSSILIGFSIINHPFWGTPIFGNTHMVDSSEKRRSLLSQQKKPPPSIRNFLRRNYRSIVAAPQKERKVKRKHRSKVPKPCVDLTALAKIEAGKPGKKSKKLLRTWNKRDSGFMSSLKIFHEFCRRFF